jgi:hypothetical protein
MRKYIKFMKQCCHYLLVYMPAILVCLGGGGLCTFRKLLKTSH